MQILGGIGKFLLGGGLLGVGVRALAKKGTPAQPLPAATRDDAAAAMSRADELRRRRGSAADQIVNGTTGAEAAIGAGRMVMGS